MVNSNFTTHQLQAMFIIVLNIFFLTISLQLNDNVVDTQPASELEQRVCNYKILDIMHECHAHQTHD